MDILWTALVMIHMKIFSGSNVSKPCVGLYIHTRPPERTAAMVFRFKKRMKAEAMIRLI